MIGNWVEGRVVEQTRWGDRLFSLKVEAQIAPFVAGQFAKLALEIDGEVVARPYSFVNAPHERPHEFYYVELSNGPLTRRLARLKAGDTVWLAPTASGFLTLAEVPDGKDLWLMATGTGIGPFLSILKTDAPWQRFERVMLVHAVRVPDDLTYAETIAAIARDHADAFRFVSVVSRIIHPGALLGRVPDAIRDGRLEARAGLALVAERARVMLCGNPGMVNDSVEALKSRGFRKHRRREPGQITVENYW